MDTPVTNFVLVAPTPTNPFTGGHLYNGRIAAWSGCEIVRVEPSEIDDWLARCRSACVLDSLYLTTADPDRLRAASTAFLAHYLPDRAPDAPTHLRERVARALAAVDGVIATSAFTAGQVRDSASGQTVHVCRPGVDPLPDRRTTEESTPRVLTVANFERRKGHLALLDCLARLRRLDWRWDVLGDTDAEDGAYGEFSARLRHHGLEDRVHVHGRQSPENTRHAMLTADVFALLTRYEPYGMVFAESIAAGTPVVAYGIGGIPESVTHDSTGLLGPLDDTTTATAHLERLLSSPSERHRMSESCRKTRFPDWEETANQFTSCVRDIMRESKK